MERTSVRARIKNSQSDVALGDHISIARDNSAELAERPEERQRIQGR